MAKHVIGMITNMLHMMMAATCSHTLAWCKSMANGGYTCNIFVQSHATSGNWNFSCEPFHKDEMGAEEVSWLSCLGMPSVCWTRLLAMERNPKVKATI
jgi:hypothetical protein